MVPEAVAPRQFAQQRQWQQQWRRRWRHRPPGGARPQCTRAQHGQALHPTHDDVLAVQRVELGQRVLRHLAGIEQVSDFQDAVCRLPLYVEPPAQAWQQLAAGVAAAGPGGLRAALGPRRYPIPSFGTLPHCRCQLTCSRAGRRFRSRQVNAFLALLFQQIPAAVERAGLPAVQLSRYDLHHGHLFYAADCRQLGLLLHAKEYPASHEELFPANLGNCQTGSGLAFDAEAMRWRNLVWLNGHLACLDMASPALAPLLMPGLELPRTLLEQDLGLPLGDVNYFAELAPGRKGAERLFVCIPGCT